MACGSPLSRCHAVTFLRRLGQGKRQAHPLADSYSSVPPTKDVPSLPVPREWEMGLRFNARSWNWVETGWRLLRGHTYRSYECQTYGYYVITIIIMRLGCPVQTASLSLTESKEVGRCLFGGSGPRPVQDAFQRHR